MDFIFAYLLITAIPAAIAAHRGVLWPGWLWLFAFITSLTGVGFLLALMYALGMPRGSAKALAT